MTPAEQMDAVRRFYRACQNGDRAALDEFVSDSVVHSIPGTSAVAGTRVGLDALLARFAELFEISGGSLRLELLHLASDGADRVIALRMSTAAREGRTIRITEPVLFTFRAGRIAEIQNFYADAEAKDEFFG